MESEDLIIQFDFDAIKTKKCFKSKRDEDKPISFEGSALSHKEAFKTRKISFHEFNDDSSFEYNALLHKKSKEILIEPLVETYLNLKWQSLKGWWYGYRFLFFIAFGVCLTLMMSFIVEMNNHCKNDITTEKYVSDQHTLYSKINTSKPELNNKNNESELVEKIICYSNSKFFTRSVEFYIGFSL